MNKQEIQDRIIAINNEMTQLKANYAKLEGHLGEAQHWMSTLLKFETEQEAKSLEVDCSDAACKDAQQNIEKVYLGE